MTSPVAYSYPTETESLQQLVVEYAGLIARIADKLLLRLPPQIEKQDLLQSGILGLLEARATYNSEYGACFKTYATLKIRYAMYQALRQYTGMSREVSQYIKKIAAILKAQQQPLSLKNEQLTDALGVSADQLAKMTQEINAYKMVSLEKVPLDAQPQASTETDPLFLTATRDVKRQLVQCIRQLPLRDQYILSFYYNHFLNFKEIGTLLDLTEARVSQLHKQLLKKLKLRLSNIQHVATGPL